MGQLMEKIKSIYTKYDISSYGIVGAGIGLAAGVIAGCVLPPYIGWKAGDYLAKAAEFGSFMSTSTKLIGAVGLIDAAYRSRKYRLFVPRLGVLCAAGGCVLGSGIGKAVNSLERLVSKK